MTEPHFLKPKKNPRAVVMDERLIRRELYNPNSFRIIFEFMEWHAEIGDVRKYCRASGISYGSERIILYPDSFCILNHAFYIPVIPGAPIGELINVISKFGNDIGNGSKLPSRPEVKQGYF